MAKVKVWNDNEHDYREEFKGEKIHIKAKGFVEMEYEEGVDFAGKFSGVAPNGADGRPDARFFKMIRVDRPATPIFKDDGLTNHLTGKRAESAAELLAEVLDIARNRPDLVVKDPELDAANKKKAGDQDEKITQLQNQLAALEARLARDNHAPTARAAKG